MNVVSDAVGQECGGQKLLAISGLLSHSNAEVRANRETPEIGVLDPAVGVQDLALEEFHFELRAEPTSTPFGERWRSSNVVSDAAGQGRGGCIGVSCA